MFIAKKHIPRRAFLRGAGVTLALPLLDLSAMDPQRMPQNLLDNKLAQQYQVVALSKRGSRLFIGGSDPTDLEVIERIKFATQLQPEWVIVEHDKLTKLLTAATPRKFDLASYQDQYTSRLTRLIEAKVAGRRVAAPVASIAGIAPRAFLGNYKVFGTPGVNNNASFAAILAALDDAVDVIGLQGLLLQQHHVARLV